MPINPNPFIFPHRQFPAHQRTLVAGLPFFPAELGATGETVKIVRCWQVESIDNYTRQLPKRVFLRLQPPEYRVYEKYSPNISFSSVQMFYQHRPDLEIMWLGQIGNTTYLILEETPFDLDDESFTQYVVKLNNPQSVSIIGVTELSKLTSILRSQIDYYPTISTSEITSFLGQINDKYSIEYYIDCIKERSISRAFRVRWDIISAGKSISIRKWQRPLPENLSISLAIPSDPTSNEDFFIKEYLGLKERHYLILQAERTLIAGEKWQAFLVRLEGNSIFSLTNDQEFQEIANAFIDRLEGDSKGNNFRPLGTISVQEVDFLLNYLSVNQPSFTSSGEFALENSSLAKTKFTNLIPIKILDKNDNFQDSFKVAEPHQQLTISRRWRISNRLYLHLSFSTQQNQDNSISKTLDLSTLLVESIFSFNFWYYIILEPPSQLNSQDKFVLKIQNNKTLITLTNEELNKVSNVYENNKNSIVATSIIEILSLLNSLSSSNNIEFNSKPITKPLMPKITGALNKAVTKTNLVSLNPNIIDNYQLNKKLGETTPHTNYLAEQINLGNRIVFLKTLAIESSLAEHIEIFLKKAKLHTKLNHLNVPKLYQVGNTKEYYFSAFQYIHGITLFEYILRKKTFSPTYLLLILKQIADVLDYAHKNQVLHGNLSPQKVLISPDDQIFLTSFFGENPGGKDRIIGNPLYLAIEQIQNSLSLPSSDIYALVEIAYLCLTGHHPFENCDSIAILLRKKFDCNIANVEVFNQSLPTTLNTVFKKALSSDLTQRYQTANDFINALKECFQNLITTELTEELLINSSRVTSNYLSVDKYLLTDLLGEGNFSWVHRGVELNNLTQKAFKIAKPRELVSLPDHSSIRTQEINITLGCVGSKIPDIEQFLSFQAEKLQKTSDPALVKVDRFYSRQNTFYYQMNYIVGKTLREIMKTRTISIRVMIEIAAALDRLSQNPNFQYHGDLKPENILVTSNSVKLIDPGYFGSKEKRDPQTMITTPAYYPMLESDDMFAFGLILWEIACQQHPLVVQRGSSEFIDLTYIGENLFDWVYSSELVGQYFKSAFLHIKRPSTYQKNIHPMLESFLLKAINLQLRADNIIDYKIHFKSFSQLIAALEELVEAGITHL
ncbi:MAG: protein kinase [Blastocatellia bacterium]